MPHLVSHTVPARQVQIGDIHTVAGVDHTVESVETKTKYTTVSYVGQDRTNRFENDHGVLVQRTEDTDEEVAAKKRAWVISSIKSRIAATPGDVISAKEKLIADLDVQDGYHGRRYENYVATQLEALLWSNVEKTGKYLVEQGEGDLYDALLLVIDEVKEQLLNDTAGASRSTSVMTNTIADVQRGVKAQWLRSNRFLTY